MTEEEVLEAIANGDSAYGLLLSADRNLKSRFDRLCRTMREYLRDVQEYFPEAQYYTAGGGFNLLLGNPHNERGKTQSQLVALSGVGVTVGDGDF